MCLDSSDDPIGPGNVIPNPGFANGLPTGWTFFGPATLSVSSDSSYVAATGRQMTYAGPAWEIAPSAVTADVTFTGQAWVQLSSGDADVALTLLVIKDGEHNFFRVGSGTGTSGCWEQISGSITIPGGADQLILYVEGPPPGTDIYVRSAALFQAVTGGQEPGAASAPGLMCIGSSRDAVAGTNLVDNSRAQIGWTCAGCIFNFSSDHSYTIATERGATYSGPTWNLNGKLSAGLANSLSVWVQLGAQVTSAPVKLTAKKSLSSEVEYIPVDETIAYAGCWTQLSGTYTLAGPSDQVAIYAEGPDPGVELWVADPAVFVPGAYGAPVPKVPQTNVCPGSRNDPITGNNLVYSPGFYGGAPGGWSCFGCELVVNPLSQNYITATGRTDTWNGPAWVLTGNIGQGSTYALQVILRVSTGSAPVQLTMHTSLNGQDDSYFPVATGTASTGCWTQINGTFTLTSTVDMVVMYVEGPPPGTNVDIMVAAVVLTVPAATIRPTPSNVCPDSLNVPPPVNSIVENPGFENGIPPTWLPFGTCQLTVSPDKQYVIASQRAQNFAGPSWDVTKLVRAGNFYRFSAWVSLPAGASTTRVLYGVAVTKNGATTFSCGGQRSITGGCWSQLNGGYNQYTDNPDKVVIYMQGPAPGVDILVQSVNVEPITRDAWLHDVTIRADRIRKTNVIVNVQDENGRPIPNAQIKIDQTKQGFPLGLAINYQLPENTAYQNFVKTRFNWAVFENEAKWYYNEPQQGQYNYAAPDAMVAWANANNILLRGHCGFWEDTQTVQPWVRALDDDALRAAMDIRLNQVADRYRGQFEHWDVDNEALHNTYFSGRLGPSIQSWMYATTQRLDPSVEMFINEYNVLEECDAAANPETFIGEAQNLEAQGFQISFGCQSHFGNPVQAFKLRADLDKLASFGRPIWITEMDSAEVDENKKADMLEFAYREYFAHPGVEGILLWTVWEGPNAQCQVCTVNGDFSNKPSGARIDQLLLDEWRTTGVVGQTDSSGDPFIFRGFYGDYTAEVTVDGITYPVEFTVFKEENGNKVYLTVPVSGSSGGRRKLLSAESAHRNLRRSALTSPERKLPSSYLTAVVPGDELRNWEEPSVRHSVRDSEDPKWGDPPAKPARSILSRSILSRQELDAAVAAHEPDGYAPFEVGTAQRLATARANHRTLLESEADELQARHVSISGGVSRQDYDAASFKNRELLQVTDDPVSDSVSDPCSDSTDQLLGLRVASTEQGFRQLLEAKEDPVSDPELEETVGGNSGGRSLLKMGPMHAYLGLGKGFDYVRLELEGNSKFPTRPNDSVNAPERGVNGPQRRLLEVEEAEAEKSEYLDTLMFHNGDLARNETEALVAFLRAEKLAVRLARGRTRR